ncbi:TetR/AcrR family transcriptional regulator [Sporichthya polymorpha]|uniref:TetR/AcrR family transcriptional regulator n=1 Tax=Sporichthya polymorpha TaxID=35751 RepID=UPI0003719FCA|nr:TetR/AcrR family transcriptional regulator [Sporichthya polymorpha]
MAKKPPIGERRDQARAEPSPAYLERRAQLLKAASEVFRRKGLQATSINDIVTEFGGDRASVYYYFPSKEAIFHEVVEAVITEMVEAAEALAAADRPVAERLQLFIEGAFDAFERHYPYQYIYIQEDLSRVRRSESASARRLLVLGGRYEAAILGVVREGVASGELRRDIDPHLFTLAILGASNWSHRWFRPGGRLPGIEIGREFAGYLLRGAVSPSLEHVP